MRAIKDIRRENVALLVKYAGGQNPFAIRIGRDRNQVYQWLLPPENPSSRGISDKMAREIERVSSLPEGTLDHEGSLSGARESEHPAATSRASSRSPSHTGYLRYQLIANDGLDAAGAHKDRPEVIKELEIAEWRLREELGHIPSPKHVKLLTVRGQSMAPRIREGDVVFVDLQDRQPSDGNIFVLLVHGHALVKRIEIRRDGYHVISLTTPGHPDIYPADRPEEMGIAGRVLGAMQLRKAEEL